MEGSSEEISPRGGAAGVPDTAAGQPRTDEPLLLGRVPLRAGDTGAAPRGDRQARVCASVSGGPRCWSVKQVRAPTPPAGAGDAPSGPPPAREPTAPRTVVTDRETRAHHGS